MKYILKHTLTLTIFFVLFSCNKKEQVLQGPPTISRVASSIDHSASLSSGDMEQWILIIGNNLKYTEKVLFSDLEVSYKDIYASDTLVSVKVPRQIPVNVTNKVTVITKTGEASYDFEINTPDFVFNSIKNEHTIEGDTLELTGAFFDLYFPEEGTQVTFEGGITVDVAGVSSDYIKVVVPAGAEMGPLTVTGPAPLNTTFVTNSSWYKDTRNLILVQPVVVPASGMVSSHPDFPKSPGLMVVRQGPYNAWEWDSFLTAYLNWPSDATGANKANYVMKFEMNTKLPITKGTIHFNIADYYYGWQYNYFGQPLDTHGEWQTITLPLNLVSHPTDNYAWFGLIHSDGESRECNFAMSNFRVVPKN